MSAQEDRMNPSVHFLRRRGWDVQLFSNFRQGLVALIEDTPDFVFLSIHLNSSHLDTARKLLSGIAQCQVIWFSEVSTVEAIHRLNHLGARNILFPPVGGPALERCLRKILLQARPSEFTVIDDGSAEGDNIYWPYGSNPRIRIGGANYAQLFSSLKSAFETYVPKTKEYGAKSIDRVNRLTCVRVKSKTFHGYIIAARATDTDVEHFLLRNIFDSVVESMSGKGEVLEEFEPFSLSVDSIPFRKWVNAQADFTRFGIRDGEELALAFFVLESKDHDLLDEKGPMLGMPLSAIEENCRFQFDIYIFLPLNGRFVRYIHRGECLDASQHLKLAAKSVKFLFFKRTDLPRWHEFNAQRFVRQQIDKFNESDAGLAA